MSHAPIIFSALPSCEDGNQNLAFHELSSSIQLLQLKSPSSSSFSISNQLNALPPRKSVICLPSSNSVGSTVISIAGKDGRNGLMVWSSLNHKPTPTLKLIPPGRVLTICLSHSGTYLAAGSNDGVVMIWELSTGTLLATFDAHYKSITCLAFSDDDAALITASEDSMCSVWSIPALLDEGANANLSYAPYVLLSDHTLPISDIHVSHGTFPDIRIFTASLDQTVKIWTPLYPSCPLLSTFAVPGPAHHLSVDPLERFIFVSYPITGSTPSNNNTDKSNIPATTNLSSSGSKYTASVVRAIPLFSRPSHAAHRGGISLVHSSNGYIHPLAPTESMDSIYTSPQDTSITALHLPSSICSSPMLLCGLSNGKIIHLALPSLQPISSTIPRASSTASSMEPVVYINVFLRPPDLMINYSGQQTPGVTTGSTNGPSTQQLIPSRTVGMLGRTIGRTGDTSRVQSNGHKGEQVDKVSLKDRVVILKLNRHEATLSLKGSSNDDDGFSLPNLDPIRPLISSTDTRFRPLGPRSDQDTAQVNVDGMISKVQDESKRLREQLGQALRLNEVMWNGIVDGTLKLSDEGASS